MKKLATVVLLALIGLTAEITPVTAQSVYVGGGGSFPMSDYGDLADTGFLLVGGGTIPLGEGDLSVTVEGFYGQNNHSDTDGDKTNPYGFMGGLIYDIGGDPESISPYVFGEAGLMVHKYSSDTFEDSSDRGFGYGGGAGLGIPLGGINAWVEGRIMNASIEDSNTMFVGVLAGISISLGD